MSRQIKKLHTYPVGENTTRVILDQQGYTATGDIDKVLVRTPDTYPTYDADYHAMLNADGYSRIVEVISQDPTEIKTSGCDLVLAGDDALIISADGYTSGRGVIRSVTQLSEQLHMPAYCSINSNHWLLGGVDLRGDGYVASVWHSRNGYSYSALTPPPWSARAGCGAVGEGNELWLIGGFEADGTATQEIWHGIVDEDLGDISWDATALGSGVCPEYTKWTIAKDQRTAYSVNGSIDLDTGTFTQYDYADWDDAYGSACHYDHRRNIMWFSRNGDKREYNIDATGAIEDTITVSGHIHYQKTPATTWFITHELNSENLVILVFDGNNLLIEPNIVSFSSGTQVTIQFNSNVSGRAFLLYALSFGSSATWTTPAGDGYNSATDIWFAQDALGRNLHPASVSAGGATLALTFTSAESGLLAVFKRNANGFGRRETTSASLSSGANSVASNQKDDGCLYLLRDQTTKESIFPASIDISTYSHTITMVGSETSYYNVWDLGTDGYNDASLPLNQEYVALGSNTQNEDDVAVLTNADLYYSTNAGSRWSQKDGIGANIISTDLSHCFIDNDLVAGKTDNYNSTYTIDAGDNWTVVEGDWDREIIEFYGQIIPNITLDTSYKIYCYERPSDVVWQSSYGHLPGTVIDRYETHYVLPYSHLITSGTTQSISFTIDTDYNRSVIANEFVGDWVYLRDVSNSNTLYRRKITHHSACAVGSELTLYWKNELSITPVAGDFVQVIKQRPDGLEMWSLLTHNTPDNYKVWHEANGNAFLLSKERAYDWFGKETIAGGLPAFISEARDDNDELLELLLTESNRQRVITAQQYNNPHTLPPDLLKELGQQYGIVVADDIDLRTQRRMVGHWHEEVDAYGPCVDGINNMLALLVGDNTITATTASPNANAISQQTVSINISDVAMDAITYSSTNNTIDFSDNHWRLKITSADTDINTAINKYLIIATNAYISDPYQIVDYDVDAGIVYLRVSKRGIADEYLVNGTSKILIAGEFKKQLVARIQNELRKLVGDYITILYT